MSTADRRGRLPKVGNLSVRLPEPLYARFEDQRKRKDGPSTSEFARELLAAALPRLAMVAGDRSRPEAELTSGLMAANDCSPISIRLNRQLGNAIDRLRNPPGSPFGSRSEVARAALVLGLGETPYPSERVPGGLVDDGDGFWVGTRSVHLRPIAPGHTLVVDFAAREFPKRVGSVIAGCRIGGAFVDVLLYDSRGAACAALDIGGNSVGHLRMKRVDGSAGKGERVTLRVRASSDSAVEGLQVHFDFVR